MPKKINLSFTELEFHMIHLTAIEKYAEGMVDGYESAFAWDAKQWKAFNTCLDKMEKAMHELRDE